MADSSESREYEHASVPHPMTIVMGCDTFPPNINGAANFAERLAVGLVQRGHDVHIVAPATSRKHGTWTEEHQGVPMTVHRLRSWRWHPHEWLRFALPWTSKWNARRILDEVTPDAVHIQSHIVIGRGLSYEAHKRGIPIVATNHIMPENMIEFTLVPKFLHKTFIRIAWNDARKSFDMARAVTTPTERAARFLREATGVNDVLAVSCGIDTSHYTPNFAPRTENRIMFVGRVTAEKQIDVLIRAVAALDPKLDAHLDIVGSGDQTKNLQALAARLGLGSRVRFCGFVSDDELHDLYAQATVFAMPSIAELQSIATMEAMASALPVVAADAMALPHLVHDGKNGYLFAPGDVRDCADKLQRILRLPDDEFVAMKNASLAIVASHAMEKTISTFESLYSGEPVSDSATDPITTATERE